MGKMKILLFMLIIASTAVHGQSYGDPQVWEYDGSPGQADRAGVLLKSSGIGDEAVGVMDKGQLQNVTMNYGQISDTRYEDVGNAPTQYFYNFRYPRADWTSLIDDFSLLFALPQNSKNGNNGNVIDGFTENDNEDWIAKDGSYGLTHYNPAADPNPHAELLYPPTNPVTPYLAHSDLPMTWPVDENGDAYWPGYFRRDPVTGEEFAGEFASDRDIYAVFTDQNNQLGNPVGVEVEMMAYCYGRPYADKFQFYEFFIHNTSDETLDSCYVGYYGDPDCSDYGEETFILPDPDFSDPDIPDALINRDFDGDIGGATSPNNLGKTEDESFALVILETPKNIGVTSFHYYQDTGPVDDKILWPIITGDPNDRDIVNFNSGYFHGADPKIDDMSTLTEPLDLVHIIASGPFSIAPGDTVKSTIAVAVGDTDDDLFLQIDQAQAMYEKGFIGPAAPPSPELHAVAVSDEAQVTLYWNDISENAKDSFTGEVDFEGYRIYRSEDNGQTWGKEVRDSRGSLLGYVPVAQFDLDNDISGYDPKNPITYLGDNSGIAHTFVDKTVNFGIHYSYTIVAYDRGDESIYSLASSRGTAVTDKNFVSVVPSPRAMGVDTAAVNSLVHTEGIGKGNVLFEIIDEFALETDNYEISFNGDPASTFNVFNATRNDTVLYNLPMNRYDNPVTDGFKISVESEGKLGGIKSITDGLGKDVDGAENSDSSWTVTYKEYTSSLLINRSNDYEIRFVDEGDIAYSWGKTATASFSTPIEVWNTTGGTERKICFEVNDINGNNEWDEGETLFIINVSYPDPNIGETLDAVFPDVFPYQVTVVNSPYDTEGLRPRSGDLIRIESYASLSSTDVFSFNFKMAEKSSDLIDFADVRVVPNPYIVGAAWEEIQNINQVRFMYLPPECTINIYTISGEKVNSIHHETDSSELDGSAVFNLVNENKQALAFGLYIYVIKTPDGKSGYGKFSIIR